MSGWVMSAADSSAIADARFVLVPRDLPDSSLVIGQSWADGRFVIFRDISPSSDLRAERSGFFPRPVALPAKTYADSLRIILPPVGGGLLFGRTYLLDARYGGIESGEVGGDGSRAADVNLAITTRLWQLLHAAGADVSRVRTADSTMSEKERAQLSAAYPPGFYLRIDAAGPAYQASCSIHPSIPNHTMAATLLHGLTVVAGLDSGTVRTPPDQFFRDVAMRTISVTVPSIRTPFFEENRERACDRLAWGLFVGILGYEGFARPASWYRALDASGRPLDGVRAVLSETLSTFADSAGYFSFYGLELPDAVLRIAGDPAAQVIRVQERTSAGF
jgi:hypothetical protein